MKKKREEFEEAAISYAENVFSRLQTLSLRQRALQFGARSSGDYDFNHNRRPECQSALATLLAQIYEEEARLWGEYYAVANLIPMTHEMRRRAVKAALRGLILYEEGRRSGIGQLTFTHAQRNLDLPLSVFLRSSNNYNSSWNRTNRDEEELIIKELELELLEQNFLDISAMLAEEK